MDTKQLAADHDYLAPDGSEIRLLSEVRNGGLAHCTLPVGATTHAVAHHTVDEIWYCIDGRGEIWRDDGKHSTVEQLLPGTSVSIEVGTRFQFRTVGEEALRVLIATMPPWPGAEEAYPVENHWPR